jgi:hypothetical protein
MVLFLLQRASLLKVLLVRILFRNRLEVEIIVSKLRRVLSSHLLVSIRLEPYLEVKENLGKRVGSKVMILERSQENPSFLFTMRLLRGLEEINFSKRVIA